MAEPRPAVVVEPAQLSDQGKVGPLLLAVFGDDLRAATAAAAKAGWPVSSVEDELMAADDFYFSNIDLMNCCLVARRGGELVGVACVNPYVSDLQYVAVRADCRRQGLGRQLVSGVLAELRRRGADHLRAELSLRFADAGGRAFLAAMGFHEVRVTLAMGRKTADQK